MEKLILDTDIGSDIDDSFALAYLLNNEDCEIVGITTCTGEAFKRAQLCDLFIEKASKRNIPICVGINDPICQVNHQPTCPQSRVLDKFHSQFEQENKNVVEFIYNKVMENEGDVTLVAIGPLTNIALAITVYPEIINKLKRLVLMGGKIDTSVDKMDLVDWNFICDPIAAKIVLNANFKEVVIYPCDVTYSLNHNKEYMHQVLKGKYSEIIKEMAEIWFERFNEYSYHDPMAVMHIFHPEFVTVEQGIMQVDFSKSLQLGMTTWVNKLNGNHFVVTDIKRENFLEVLYETINR